MLSEPSKRTIDQEIPTTEQGMKDYRRYALGAIKHHKTQIERLEYAVSEINARYPEE